MGSEQQELRLAPAPLARVRGTLLQNLPQDLYIPPQALEVFLETFEGPLDLLLYLIRKNSLDILDIPMALLTRQYLDYVEEMRRHQLELAADYLLMAAVLIEIKARWLLPRPAHTTQTEAEDPRAELMRRLLAYEQIKRAAQAIERIPRAGRDFVPAGIGMPINSPPRLPQLRAQELGMAWAVVLQRSHVHRHHRIERERLSVREHMSLILKLLQQHSPLDFGELVKPGVPIPVCVVYFVALLELVKEKLVRVSQCAAYAPLYLAVPAQADAELLIESGERSWQAGGSQ